MWYTKYFINEEFSIANLLNNIIFLVRACHFAYTYCTLYIIYLQIYPNGGVAYVCYHTLFNMVCEHKYF